jgi:hypothetical protein
MQARGWEAPPDLELAEPGQPTVGVPALLIGGECLARIPLAAGRGATLRIVAAAPPARLWLRACGRLSATRGSLPAALSPDRTPPPAPVAPTAGEVLAELERAGLEATLDLLIGRWLEGGDIRAGSAALLRALAERPLCRSPRLGPWAALLTSAARPPA